MEHSIPTFPRVSLPTRAYQWFEYWRKRARGYAVANRYARAWWIEPAWRVERDLRDIKRRLGLSTFGRVLEMGCHLGRLTPAIAPHANEVWGADIFQTTPAPVARYVRVSDRDPGSDNYFPALPDGCVDAIMAIDFTGFGPGDAWPQSFERGEQRLARFFTPGNFRRLLSPGGLLIVMQHDSFPETRVGKTSVTEMDRRVDAIYQRPEIANFKLISSGWCRWHAAPFLVYRRL
jgi:SAM-dependent methyltransferase